MKHLHFAKHPDAPEVPSEGDPICNQPGRHTITAIFDEVTCRNCIRVVRAENAREERAARTFVYTRALHRRAEREGWGIFNDREVQRLDDDDADRGYLLKDDDEAIALARAAGVPVLDDGALDCDELQDEPDPDEGAKRIPVKLTRRQLRLLADALDSHQYWQLSDEHYRNDGFVHPPGSDDDDTADTIELCDRLAADLTAAADKLPKNPDE